MLLRAAGRERVQEVDWDTIRFESYGSAGRCNSTLVTLGNPLGFTRRETEQAFKSGLTFEELLELLGGRQEPKASGCGWSEQVVSKGG